jgi:hypothetical protein
MANCVTCGDELHPDRAERYDYCPRPECVERNAKGLRIVAVGVNKAADQYVVLNERTKREMASGRYRKQPDAPDASHRPVRARRAGTSARTPVLVPRSDGTQPRWSEAQEKLALIYRDMGLRPDEIAKRIGVSPHLVTRILLNAT